MKISIALLFLLLSLTTQASQKAITDEGDIVILNDDGTWVFESPDTVTSVEIPINDAVFSKSPDSSFKLKSVKTNSEIWLNAKKWAFSKGDSDEDAEYNFQLKGEDVYGQLITEKIELDIVTLTNAAFENAKSASADIKIVNREYRVVNGTNVLFMQMQGNIQGSDFTFLGYYFANETGSTQFLIYTGTTLVEQYSNEIYTFLNGFSTQ